MNFASLLAYGRGECGDEGFDPSLSVDTFCDCFFHVFQDWAEERNFARCSGGNSYGDGFPGS